MSIPKSVTKAHATGNDFIAYLDSDGRFEPTADEVRQLCDRHFGIGADGVVLVRPSDDADCIAPTACSGSQNRSTSPI